MRELEDAEVLEVNGDGGDEEGVECHGWLRRVGEDAGDAEQGEVGEVDEDCERARASFYSSEHTTHVGASIKGFPL